MLSSHSGAPNTEDGSSINRTTSQPQDSQQGETAQDLMSPLRTSHASAIPNSDDLNTFDATLTRSSEGVQSQTGLQIFREKIIEALQSDKCASPTGITHNGEPFSNHKQLCWRRWQHKSLDALVNKRAGIENLNDQASQDAFALMHGALHLYHDRELETTSRLIDGITYWERLAAIVAGLRYYTAIQLKMTKPTEGNDVREFVADPDAFIRRVESDFSESYAAGGFPEDELDKFVAQAIEDLQWQGSLPEDDQSG